MFELRRCEELSKVLLTQGENVFMVLCGRETSDCPVKATS